MNAKKIITISVTVIAGAMVVMSGIMKLSGLATELSHGMPFNAVLPMALIWISAFLRDSSIFLPGPTMEKMG